MLASIFSPFSHKKIGPSLDSAFVLLWRSAQWRRRKTKLLAAPPLYSNCLSFKMCLCLHPPPHPYVCLDSPFAFCGPIFPTGNGKRKAAHKNSCRGRHKFWCFLNKHKVTFVQENALSILSKSAVTVYVHVAKRYSLVLTRAKRTNYM